jgi:hypothetical protein
MKITGAFATALLVGSASAAKSAKVGVTCKNLDVNSLTPKALAYAAKAVEMTFNEVHNKETAHAVAVGSFAGDSNLRTKVSLHQAGRHGPCVIPNVTVHSHPCYLF